MDKISIVCRTCRRPLDKWDRFEPGEDEIVTTWLHPAVGEPYDHEPDPVQMNEMDMLGVCDFCATEGPRWIYPVRDFEVPFTEGAPTGQISNGDWAACDDCHELIKRERWQQLVARVLEQRKPPKFMRSAMRQSLHILYARVRQHATGDPRKLW